LKPGRLTFPTTFPNAERARTSARRSSSMYLFPGDSFIKRIAVGRQSINNPIYANATPSLSSLSTYRVKPTWQTSFHPLPSCLSHLPPAYPFLAIRMNASSPAVPSNPPQDTHLIIYSTTASTSLPHLPLCRATSPLTSINLHTSHLCHHALIAGPNLTLSA